MIRVKKGKVRKDNKYIISLITGALAVFLIAKIVPTAIDKVKSANINIPFFTKVPTPTPDMKKQQEELTKMVLPDQFDLGISFKDAIVKLVQNGAIDKEKFLAIYEGRGGLTADEKSLLDKPSDQKIIVTAQNSGFILNLLWPLGIANKTKVLSEGPMGTNYKDKVGNFASTGGWTVGKKSGGELFDSLTIVKLTPDLEKTAKEIAENIYRPCCGNSTYFPDCNHGAAMLGFIELALSQGMSKQDIYKKALVLNSYWFPQTYVELAVYFKNKNNTPWNKVDPIVALGADYSSGQGYVKVNKELQEAGLLPKVEGGGGCGV